MSSLYYVISFFIFGLMFGSFFNVVGFRLPYNKSIIYPPSSCPHCGRRLTAWELIPVFSYIFLLGKCHGCKHPISWKYPFFEIFTGVMFLTSYFVFGFSNDLIIALTFISALIIIIISDINSMTIPDEVIIVATVAVFIELIVFKGYTVALLSLGNGLLSFIVMYIIKLLGDYVFNRESLGGGDIKLMLFIGIVDGFILSIAVIILGAFIALPVALLVLIYRKTNVISFGPFLGLAGIIIYLMQININEIINSLLVY